MKVVLLRNVESVGKTGQIKEVSDGFARNFLIPQGLAEVATDAAIQKAQKLATDLANKNQQELEANQKLAEKLEGKEIIIKAKAQKGKLFGSIGANNIVEKLKEEGLTLQESNFAKKFSIRELGDHSVKINLGHGIEAHLKVTVVSE